MAAYIDKPGMQERFSDAELIAITDRSGAGSIDDAVLNLAIDGAESEADSYLMSRYPVPVSPVPVVLTDKCADITRHRLHLTYNASVPENVESAYKAALAWLADVRDGKQHLDGVNEREDGSGNGPVGTRRTMTMSDDCLAKMPGAAC